MDLGNKKYERTTRCIVHSLRDTHHTRNVITNKIKNELQKQIKYFDNDTTNIVINNFFLY